MQLQLQLIDLVENGEYGALEGTLESGYMMSLGVKIFL